MNLSSDRLKTQIYFESLLGCTNPEAIKQFQDNATGIVLNRGQATAFRKFCGLDARSFLFKGAVSLFSALSGISKGRQTWPVVQLYYANYYLLRAELLLRNRCILRANRVFTTLCLNGEAVEKVSNKNAKSDHDLTIFFAKKYLNGLDVLLSQEIEGELPYEWLKKQRDWYQYKQDSYIELNDIGPFYSFEQMDLLTQVNMFLADSDPYFCFDPDYAALALPIKRFQLSLISANEHAVQFDNNAKSKLLRFQGEGLACARVLQLL
ncbi:hypothetical protein SAMN04488515_0319 [Cognatiyoonia koreensis]|uniref:Uncharacterized protein n=1 Tax=Cognatiyoonia koreensis TaxID=364200 RepID=A0A1I0MZ48_9RHOB|nr:hypothetical protein [Cognatiyoonia koreensis]SEV93921.1 hypothetical protein SAMN04488515_0319 [Cognatiyoonia koreensis]